MRVSELPGATMPSSGVVTRPPSEHVSILLTARAHLNARALVEGFCRALELRSVHKLVARAAVVLPLLERELEGDLELACVPCGAVATLGDTGQVTWATCPNHVHGMDALSCTDTQP